MKQSTPRNTLKYTAKRINKWSVSEKIDENHVGDNSSIQNTRKKLWDVGHYEGTMHGFLMIQSFVLYTENVFLKSKKAISSLIAYTNFTVK